MHRLYIDFSETYYSKLNTGIQRVVRNILERKETFERFNFDKVVGVIQIGSSYYKSDLGDKLPFRFTSVLHWVASRLRNFVDFIFRKNKREVAGIKWNTVSGNLNKGGVVDRNKIIRHMQVILFFRWVLQKLFKVSEYIDVFLMQDLRIKFTKNDTLFIPDAFWSGNTSMTPILNAKKSRTKVIVLFHDIFPITHNELVEEGNVVNFKNRFAEIVPVLDGFICNSEFTLSEVSAYLNRHYPEFKNLHSDFFHLGCDINSNQHIYKYSNRDDIYLMVGTIEPRKNHDYVLDAFQALWDNGIKVKLCIVGKIGWNRQQTIDRIRDSLYYRKYLFMFNEVADSELVKFYSNCKVLICCSIAEGFGLPLVEAMVYKKPVLASDIPAFREIGGDYPYYFSLENPAHLKKLIIKFEEKLIPEKKRLPDIQTWDDAVKELAGKFSKLVFQ